MATTDASRLLSTLLYSGGSVDSSLNPILNCWKLRGSQARGEEHNQTSALPLFFELALSNSCLRLRVVLTHFNLPDLIFGRGTVAVGNILSFL